MGCKQAKQTAKVESTKEKDVYTCSMHPEIVKEAPGDCPICGMHLTKKLNEIAQKQELDLNTLLQPTNHFVVSSIPITTMSEASESYQIQALGSIAYDTRAEATIASKINGRIEKLYIRYRYQHVEKGQKIMEVYSPEILTAEQNLLFLLQNDPSNSSLIDAAKQRLEQLGMEEQQLKQIIQTRNPLLNIAVYSKYSGHVHEAGAGKMNTQTAGMKDIAALTEELPLKEGMYTRKGETVFTIYNPNRAWVLLNIFGADQAFVKIGNEVAITPETSPKSSFKGRIDFIEPFFRKDSKTVTARVYFDNSSLQIPIGSQVKAVVKGNTKKAFWLPSESIVSLGLDKIVFIKQDGGFSTHLIKTGIISNKMVELMEGLTAQDSIAANAQYLMDSESFIKLKNKHESI